MTYYRCHYIHYKFKNRWKDSHTDERKEGMKEGKGRQTDGKKVTHSPVRRKDEKPERRREGKDGQTDGRTDGWGRRKREGVTDGPALGRKDRWIVEIIIIYFQSFTI